MAKSPNILFLLSDQQRWDTLGVLNGHIRTPNLDRLAQGGTLFERAYAPTAVCLPCRSSLLTGQYASTHGATHNHAQLLQTHSPLLSQTLRGRGYYTHMVGKSHLSPCHDPLSLESAPHIHNREYFRRWNGPWYGFERADVTIGHSTEKHACGMHYGAWLEDQGVDLSRYFGNTAYEQFGSWDLPEQFSNSAWTAEKVIGALNNSQEQSRPFFIWANFQDPHNPCMVPEPWASMYDPGQLPTFGFKPGEPECFAQKPPFYRELLEQPGPYACHPSDSGLPGAGNVSSFKWTQQQVQQNAACYYGMISLMDKYVGRILDELERSGLAGNTLVVFGSDHGDLLGDHGLWWKSLVCYEESIRVPLIARLPGRIPAGARSRAFQSLIDLFPTFCDFVGTPVPFDCEGVSQRETWEGSSPSAREDVVVEERPYDTDFNQRILVNDTHKLAFYAGREYGELYDLAKDPHLVRNLWNEPAAQSIKHAMIARLLGHEMNKSHPRMSPSRSAR